VHAREFGKIARQGVPGNRNDHGKAKYRLYNRQVDANLITDWQTLHSVFAEKFGLPGFYGRDMDAWVDCLSYLDVPGAEMSSIHAQSGQTLSLVIDSAQSFKRRCPEQFEALVECAAFVNWRIVVAGRPPLLALAFNV
jgi:RNAse (barnase) inhibitor barstar